MIIGSDVPLVIGQQYRGLSDAQPVAYPDQPYTVLRESTLEEWREEYERETHRVVHTPTKRAWFYDVSTD